MTDLNLSKPLISVIVPVYKVEAYLEQCIESIVHQTYTNLEIILVDDGSPDRCPQIIDEWAGRDSRIIPIHKENGGQSSARNMGLDIATGEYITFVDSDDMLETDGIQILYKGITEYNAEISSGGLKQIRDGEYLFSKYLFKDKPEYFCLSAREAVGYFIKKNIAVMAKLYKAEILADARFPEGRKAEEDHFMFGFIPKVNKVCICNRDVYDYTVRLDSDSHAATPDYLLDCVQTCTETYYVCKKDYPEILDTCEMGIRRNLYALTVAESISGDAIKLRSKVVEDAVAIVGDPRDIKVPPEDIIYAYKQLSDYMTSEEKKNEQRKFRKIWTKKYFLKPHFVLAYVSLELNKRVVKVVRPVLVRIGLWKNR